jgi:CBS domain-containing protein
MAQSIREVMTTNPVTLAPDAPIAEAARAMRDNDTGAILVSEGDHVRGLVTDRDIAVRAVADGRDPDRTSVGEIATTDLRTVDADSSVEDAIAVVRGSDVRRVPVVEDGKPVGIVSIGDLAIERDEESALADISSAPRNN